VPAPAHGVAIFFHAPLHLVLGLFTGTAVFLLDQADQLVLLAADPVEVVIGEFAHHDFNTPPHLLPLAGKDVLVHRIVLQCLVQHNSSSLQLVHQENCIAGVLRRLGNLC
jgi:hypothetical protein